MPVGFAIIISVRNSLSLVPLATRLPFRTWVIPAAVTTPAIPTFITSPRFFLWLKFCKTEKLGCANHFQAFSECTRFPKILPTPAKDFEIKCKTGLVGFEYDRGSIRDANFELVRSCAKLFFPLDHVFQQPVVQLYLRVKLMKSTELA